MTELRSVDPRTLMCNPNNPRRTPASPAMDEQLLASIRTVGIIQPPLVTPNGDGLMIVAGARRVRAAIRAELPEIEVMVGDADEAADAMRAVAENMVRADMSSVDIWRGIDRLEAQGWNEQAIADALARPVRTVRRLKLLAHVHPPMLDAMALGSMPNDEQLRTIAAAAREEQARVWKKHKPRKNQPDVVWWEVARALAKRRMSAAAARFDDELAKTHGVVWEDDLFAPAGEDGRYTTNVDGFFAAQQAWLAANLPKNGTVLEIDEFGNAHLPKKAERVWGKTGKGDFVGHYVDARTGEIEAIPYRLAAPKQTGKADGDAPAAKARPEVTRKGVAMIGDLRTDALHRTLAEAPIEDDTLLGLLVLAFAGDNVIVNSGNGLDGEERRAIALDLTENGALTADPDKLRLAARKMLAGVLSCRENRSQSGLAARIAGEAIGASERLANMATPEFLTCLSRGALESTARAEGVNLAPKAKHTRERLVSRFKEGVFVWPGALFRPTPDELAAAEEAAADAASRSNDPDSGSAGDDGFDPALDDEDEVREAA